MTQPLLTFEKIIEVQTGVKSEFDRRRCVDIHVARFTHAHGVKSICIETVSGGVPKLPEGAVTHNDVQVKQW